MPNKEIKVVLEYDDFTPCQEGDCMDFVDNVISIYPNIVFNFFTTPNYKGYNIIHNKSWCSRLRGHINNNNICVCLHGLNHDYLEFLNKSFDETISIIKESEAILQNCGIEFAKCFRFPFWACNINAVKALKELGYTWYLHENDINLSRKLDFNKCVQYNWNLNSDYDGDYDIVVAHGHTTEFNDNGIRKTFHRVEDLIKRFNVKFIKADDI